MDYLAPPMLDVSNIDIWKFKMNAYQKALGLYVYLTTTNKIYFGKDKYLEANAQAMDALKQILSKEHLSIISHCDFAFTV